MSLSKSASPGANRLLIAALLTPAALIGFVLFGGAMILVIIESFKTFTPGRIIQPWSKFTLENYQYFLTGPYLRVFATTFRLSLVSAILSLLFSFPLAYCVVRTPSIRLRSFLLMTLVTSLFVGGMVRVVSLVILLGGQGLVNSMLGKFNGFNVAFLGTETGVLIGLVHFEIPVTVLALIGAIRNVGLHIEEAAQSLGASKARCFLAITLPLSMPGIVAGGVLAFTSAVSAFTIPAFLGKGIVNMASNLIYDRFSDVFDFPEGSALAMILLVWSIALSFGLSIFLVRVVRRRSS